MFRVSVGHTVQATQSFAHVLTYRTHPVRIHLPSLTFVRPRDQQHHRVRFRTGSFYSRNRARGGLARGTARTNRARPCRPGTVQIATTAATRHLYRHSRSRCRHASLAHLRATRPKLHTTFNLTTGDAAACSCMATDISRVYSDLTHAVFLTHGRSLTRASYTHTPSGALTRGVSHTRGGSRPRAASRAHVVSPNCGAPVTP